MKRLIIIIFTLVDACDCEIRVESFEYVDACLSAGRNFVWFSEKKGSYTLISAR